MSASLPTKPPIVPVEERPFEPFGTALEVLQFRGDELIVSGPAGTGKSRVCLEKVFAIATKYAGCRILLVRKTRESLTEAALVTWEEKVVPEGHPCLSNVQRRTRQSYQFPNGSVVVVGGLDKPTKIMSTEYDVIYVQESIELTENDWESLTTRLRNGMVPYQQIIGDTNPDSPHHWIYKRSQSGTLRLIHSRHQDNPAIWDMHHNCPTERGKVYLSKLNNLTGVRKLRLADGLWVQAEGVVYPQFDDRLHRPYRRHDKETAEEAFYPQRDWPRFWGIDWGYRNPFVWQEWILTPDDRLYRWRELYLTNTLVEDICPLILEVCGWKMEKDRNGQPTGKLQNARPNPDPLPTAVICDHDAEDRKTFERHTGLDTKAAYKDVATGIQAMQSRLKTDHKGKPRLYYVRDALIHNRDAELEAARLPCSTEEEIGLYIWDKPSADGKERPVKKNDHGCDTSRYVVAYVDDIKHVEHDDADEWELYVV